MKEFQIRISGDSIRYIYDDLLLPLAKLGVSQINRASYVEPLNVEWWVDLSPIRGPKLGPFKRKEDALKSEIDWINSNHIPIPMIENEKARISLP